VNLREIFYSHIFRRAPGLVLLVVILSILGTIACNRNGGSREFVYVSVPQANLRDRVAAVYNKVGLVKSGDRVQVLDRQRRFLRVRTASREEGWLEERFTITEAVYKQFQKLDDDSKPLPSQGRALTRAKLNMHLEPSRDAGTLYQLTEGEKVDIFKRAATERPEKQAVAIVKPDKGGDSQKPPKMYDDWWLVRSQSGHYGWVLGRMIDLDIPLEVAQYAEGQRIQAAFVLDQVEEDGQKFPQYLVLLSEPRDGLPYDFDQFRVFTRNTRKHRYETAYRERNLVGFFPVKVATENFDKEGVLPAFTLRLQAENGQVVERKYKLNTPIVRRVVQPGEEAIKLASSKKQSESRQPKSRKSRQ
jgi:SH3-like domain-containing protein